MGLSEKDQVIADVLGRIFDMKMTAAQNKAKIEQLELRLREKDDLIKALLTKIPTGEAHTDLSGKGK